MQELTSFDLNRLTPLPPVRLKRAIPVGFYTLLFKDKYREWIPVNDQGYISLLGPKARMIRMATHWNEGKVGGPFVSARIVPIPCYADIHG
ncbi:MAG: hypothetical protein EOP83_21610 [Verrucomicrobiaceae bacterium]|nr:MAG: hypothetical protein EOP83_21610 [Verrucomicrobiaceae bacterium]